MGSLQFTAHNSSPAQFTAAQFTAHNLPQQNSPRIIHHEKIKKRLMNS
jgi:hypothetical protein